MERSKDEDEFEGIEVPTIDIPESPPTNDRSRVNTQISEAAHEPTGYGHESHNQPFHVGMSSDPVTKKKKKKKKRGKRRQNRVAPKMKLSSNRSSLKAHVPFTSSKSERPSPSIAQLTKDLRLEEEDTKGDSAKEPQSNPTVAPKLSARLDRLVRKQRRPLPQTDADVDTDADTDADTDKAMDKGGRHEVVELAFAPFALMKPQNPTQGLGIDDGQELEVQGNTMDAPQSVAPIAAAGTTNGSEVNDEVKGEEAVVETKEQNGVRTNKHNVVETKKIDAAESSGVLEMHGASVNTGRGRQESGRSAKGDVKLGLSIARRLRRLVSVRTVGELSVGDKQEVVRMATALVQMKQRLRRQSLVSTEEQEDIQLLVLVMTKIEQQLRHITSTSSRRR